MWKDRNKNMLDSFDAKANREGEVIQPFFSYFAFYIA